MREKLKENNGLRKEFVGTFVRFGSKTNYKGYPETTILLANIQLSNSKKIFTEHLWFMMTKEFDKIGLKEGDLISFQARTKEYWKGYKGHRYDDEEYLNEHPIEKDYKLSHPTKVQLLKRKEVEILPLVNDNLIQFL